MVLNPLPPVPPAAAATGAVSTLAEAPAAFGVAGLHAVRTLHAVGAQVYQCRATSTGLAWAAREPIATLIENGATVGRHFAGPRWQLEAGETLRGRAVMNVPGATASDADLLKLEVVEHGGGDALHDVRVVLRLNTRGGALKGPCDREGELRPVSYAADYVFLR